MPTTDKIMAIDYDHSKNLHTLVGPREVLPVIFPKAKPQSLLDVGCGTGTWLKAALEFAIPDVFGIDGIAVQAEKFLVAKTFFQQQDLNQPWNLGRRFDAALCLEVAEHLDEKYAGNLIESLTRHTDTIIFSAACPGQSGQHHVNCQWPIYWQQRFNECGYVCSDEIRWRIWNRQEIEPWYRQNILIARRDVANAGNEPRICSVMHPAILKFLIEDEFSKNIQRIAQGALPFNWYLNSFPKVFFKKIFGKFK